MIDDIRKLEKIILNMRPNGVIQTQIVEALKAILWLFQQQASCKIPDKLTEAIKELKDANQNSTPTVVPSLKATPNGK